MAYAFLNWRPFAAMALNEGVSLPMESKRVVSSVTRRIEGRAAGVASVSRSSGFEQAGTQARSTRTRSAGRGIATYGMRVAET